MYSEYIFLSQNQTFTLFVYLTTIVYPFHINRSFWTTRKDEGLFQMLERRVRVTWRKAQHPRMLWQSTLTRCENCCIEWTICNGWINWKWLQWMTHWMVMMDAIGKIDCNECNIEWLQWVNMVEMIARIETLNDCNWKFFVPGPRFRVPQVKLVSMHSNKCRTYPQSARIRHQEMQHQNKYQNLPACGQNLHLIILIFPAVFDIIAILRQFHIYHGFLSKYAICWVAEHVTTNMCLLHCFTFVSALHWWTQSSLWLYAVRKHNLTCYKCLEFLFDV